MNTDEVKKLVLAHCKKLTSEGREPHFSLTGLLLAHPDLNRERTAIATGLGRLVRRGVLEAEPGTQFFRAVAKPPSLSARILAELEHQCDERGSTTIGEVSHAYAATSAQVTEVVMGCTAQGAWHIEPGITPTRARITRAKQTRPMQITESETSAPAWVRELDADMREIEALQKQAAEIPQAGPVSADQMMKDVVALLWPDGICLDDVDDVAAVRDALTRPLKRIAARRAL